MQNLLEYILFLSFSSIFRIFGVNFSRKFSSVLAVVFFYVIPIRKSTVIDNLEHAFPGLDKEKIREIAYGSYKSFAVTLIEILCLPSMNEDKLRKVVSCPNISLVKEKYSEQNGLVLLSAHFGNWEYLAISIGLQVGIPLSVIVKSQRNPYVTTWLNKFRTKWNNEVVPLGISIRKTYQTLKEHKIVAMVADQRGSQDGVKVNFFDREISVQVGPAVLALKTGAPILIAIPVRQSNGLYSTEFAEISKENLTGTQEEKIKELSQRYISYLEKYIRKNPEQWLWMHKRWKH